MSKWHSSAPAIAHIAGTRLRRYTAGLAVVLGAFASTLPSTPSAWGADPGPQSTSEESSVLVATRDLASAQNAGTEVSDGTSSRRSGDSLQPVAQSSDNVPELAAAEERSSRLEFGNAASKREQSAKAALAERPSATPADGFPEEPVKFQGIVVGQATRQQLLDSWGEPVTTLSTAEGTVMAFDIDPFQAVEVLVADNEIVSAIKIALASPLEPAQLAEQLSLSDIRPVMAFDAEDEPLGQAFPERGVIFMYLGSDSDALAGDGKMPPAVSHVVLQRLDPLAYVMRAESASAGSYTESIADLKMAIKLDPQCAHAHYLLAKINLEIGQVDQAVEAAAKACELEPDNAGYQLLHGKAQAIVGKLDDAVLTIRAVLDQKDIAPIVEAQALHQMGCLASLGDGEIASKSIGFHTRAIEAADPIAISRNGKDRRAAKQLLVEAHMAIAEEVARQAFDKKVQTLSLWVGRASGIAEDYIATDGGSIGLRLMIAQRALNALASFRPTLDPTPWVAEADEAGKEMLAMSDDELWQAKVKWELGIAYLNALRVEHVRRETQNAINYGNKAVDYLALGASTRQAVYSSEQLIGQLYFQLGAVQAVHQLDHVKAAQWYDKAEPLLTSARPKSELYAPRREGEMLVSMGVTYWQLGEKDRAVALTQSGVDLVEAAVEAGILAKSTLGVPYNNLATMYQKMGERDDAAKYTQLAKTIEEAQSSQHGQLQEIRQASGAMQSNGQRPRRMTPR